MLFKSILNYGDVYKIFLKEGSITCDIGIYLGPRVRQGRLDDKVFYLFYIDGNIKFLDPYDYQFYNIKGGNN